MSIIKEKSFAFAVRIVNLNKHLMEVKKEYIMSKQLIRSGTAVGALVREAQNPESIKDFIHKLAIALKECDESMYWLELLKATNYLTDTEFDSMHFDATELLKMIKSAISTSKKKLSS